MTWWQNSVVYQVYPRSFADSNGDGVGDIGGIRAHLDHIASLGADVIWLSPVYPSPQDDNGYDISDYQDIDPVFGTLAEFDLLLAEVHERGMKLVMDLVVNHTSDEHPWFVESRSSKDSPKREWYLWRPEPTNWQSVFSGSAWELDEATGEYYLHLFSRKQPDLNWENPALRQEIYRMMRWWLDRGVDGFRMDVINLISKGELVDGPPIPGTPYGDGSASFVNGPRVHEYLQEMHSEVFAGRPALLTVGEMPGVPLEEARLFTDPARREVDMVFQFEHVCLDQGPGGKFDTHPLRLTDLKKSLGRWQTGLADVGWNSLYWNNHDQPRVVSRFGDDSPEFRRDSATCLATLLHLHRGTPYVYQGEELGMANSPFASVSDFRDIESLNYYSFALGSGASPETVLKGLCAAGRDNARTPMQWSSEPHAGFSSVPPWIGVNPDYLEWNASAQYGDTWSVFSHYQRLIRLRRELPVVSLGDFTMLLPEDERVYAFERSLGDARLVVMCNVSGEAVGVSSAGALVLGNMPDPEDGVLRAWEARVHWAV
ncbi:alpha-glucosidase [Allokutzneria sp. A3M-2-11 16]|uniref:glycoside hydrolase family 13 protein n=1 Tax=Allokutzneria sp. A3M-2-11 16 TaxID=2962043 RepID=UPI0020B72F57|nr:alpha-glucosidase [Allokutzneria sp. A3M-2-11 16]MCP3802619.1 alpha-glucosidase [Allokutzneria sp. A3M-2-11 16]